MKPQIMFIHGGEPYDSYEDFIENLKTESIRNPYYKGPQSRWKDDLCQKFMSSTDVLYPTMPNKYNSRYPEWKIWFERHSEYITRDIVLIGHSLGGIFLAKYISENSLPFSIKALYIVSAPFWTKIKQNKDFHGFALNPEKLPEIEKKTDEITIFHSKDDPIVPVSHGTSYKKALPAAKYIEFEDRGHFMQEEFPEIIESIRNLS